MKEINKEVLAKIFAQYLGAEHIDYSNVPMTVDGYTVKNVAAGLNYQLLLHDLRDITDEDAVKLAEIVGGFSLSTRTITKIARENDGIYFEYSWEFAGNKEVSAYKLYYKDVENSKDAADYCRRNSIHVSYDGIDLFEADIAKRKEG